LTRGIDGYPEDAEIAFRIFNDDSHAPYFPHRKDIRCSNWQHFDINQPQERKGAERRITYFPEFATNWISISTSPRRIWNITIDEKKPGRADQRIAVLDLRVLERLGIAYGSTTFDRISAL
jgi:hypothetical protein